MATMGLSTGSLKRVRSLAQQWEATHGRKATPDVMQGLMEAELANATKGANEAVRLEQDQERIDMAKEQADKQAEAQKVSGIVQTGLLAKQLGAGKAIGKGVDVAKGLFGAGGAATGAEGVGVGGASIAEGFGATATEGSALLGGGTGGSALTAESALTGQTLSSGGTAGATGTEAAGGGGAGVGAGIAALVLADAKIASDAHGRFTSLKDRNRTNVTGLEFGGVSPGAAALFQKHGILSADQLIEKYTGFDPGKGLEDVFDFASDLVDDILPGVSDYLADLGF